MFGKVSEARALSTNRRDEVFVTKNVDKESSEYRLVRMKEC